MEQESPPVESPTDAGFSHMEQERAVVSSNPQREFSLKKHVEIHSGQQYILLNIVLEIAVKSVLKSVLETC